jgi:molybdenum cofactor cytidylyltransferase
LLVEEPRSKTDGFSDAASQPGRSKSLGPINCSVVVFAAGLSTRFGRNKLLERLGDSILVAHVVTEATHSRAHQVVVVGGYQFEELKRALDGFPCEVVYNEDYTRGQSFSVRKGMSMLNGSADAVMFEPGDMPLASRTLFDAVIFEYAKTRAPIVSAGYRGRPGHPILFERSLFEELKDVNESTRGLKKVVSAHRTEARIVETSVGALFDLDTPYDLSLLKERRSDAESNK